MPTCGVGSSESASDQYRPLAQPLTELKRRATVEILVLVHSSKQTRLIRSRLTGGNNADTFVFAKNYDADKITDFADNSDTLQLNDDLWGGGLTAQQVINMFASSVGGNTVFDFGGGDVLRVNGIANPNVLANDIDIV